MIVKEEMKKYYNEGYSYAQIGLFYNLTRQRVHQIVKNYQTPKERFGKGKMRRKPVDRFWEKVHVKKDNKCWEWAGCKYPKGYGRFWTGKEYDFSHRFSWRLFNKKKIPSNLHVLHFCHNPSCVNPNHLALGTQKENIRHREERKRGKTSHLDMIQYKSNHN